MPQDINALALRIVRVIGCYNDNVLREGVDEADVKAIEDKYREYRIKMSFQVAADRAKAEWVASVLALAAK